MTTRWQWWHDVINQKPFNWNDEEGYQSAPAQNGFAWIVNIYLLLVCCKVGDLRQWGVAWQAECQISCGYEPNILPGWKAAGRVWQSMCAWCVGNAVSMIQPSGSSIMWFQPWNSSSSTSRLFVWGIVVQWQVFPSRGLVLKMNFIVSNQELDQVRQGNDATCMWKQCTGFISTQQRQLQGCRQISNKNPVVWIIVWHFTQLDKFWGLRKCDSRASKGT